MGEPGERCDAGDLSGGVTGRGASMGLASEDMTADAEVTLDTHTFPCRLLRRSRAGIAGKSLDKMKIK